MNPNSLLRNYLNYYHFFLKVFTNNNLIQEYIPKILINMLLDYKLYNKTLK